MKKLTLVAIALSIVGCASTSSVIVTGKFYNSNGELIRSGYVTNGEIIEAPGGAELSLSGAEEATILPASYVKHGLHSSPFTLPTSTEIAPLTGDIVISVGDSFSFSLVVKKQEKYSP